MADHRAAFVATGADQERCSVGGTCLDAGLARAVATHRAARFRTGHTAEFHGPARTRPRVESRRGSRRRRCLPPLLFPRGGLKDAGHPERNRRRGLASASDLLARLLGYLVRKDSAGIASP